MGTIGCRACFAIIISVLCYSRLSCIFFSAFPAYAGAQTLQQALAVAYQKNPGLMAEQAKLRAADEQVAIALSGYRPSIDAVAEGGHTRNQVSGQNYYAGDSKLNPRSIGINVTQPVFNGFKTMAEVDSAKAAVMSQRAALQEAEQQLLLDSAKAFLDVVQATAIFNLTLENEQVLKKQLEATEDRFNVGELKKTDISQAQSRFKAASVSRLQASGTLNNKRMAFMRLIGDMPTSLEHPQNILIRPTSLNDAVDLALHQNPTVIAASHNFEKSKSDISSPSGELWPKVDLVGNVQRAWDQSITLTDKQDSAAIKLRVTVPLYRAGADYARVRVAQQTSTQRRLELDDAQKKTREIASSAWQDLETSRGARAGRAEVVTAAQEALVGVREESKFGTRTVLDVLNAEQELLEAKIAYARAEHDETLAALQVRSSIGELTAQAMELDVPLYNPEINYDTARNTWAGFADTQEQ